MGTGPLTLPSPQGESLSSSFSLLYTYIDTITDLEDGQSIGGRCSPNQGHFYRYVIHQPSTVSQTTPDQIMAINVVSCHLTSMHAA